MCISFSKHQGRIVIDRPTDKKPKQTQQANHHNQSQSTSRPLNPYTRFKKPPKKENKKMRYIAFCFLGGFPLLLGKRKHRQNRLYGGFVKMSVNVSIIMTFYDFCDYFFFLISFSNTSLSSIWGYQSGSM